MKDILTPREKSIFKELIKNNTTKDIAKSLGISEKTVRNHISNTMQKLGVKGRAACVVELLIALALSYGFVLLFDRESSQILIKGTVIFFVSLILLMLLVIL